MLAGGSGERDPVPVRSGRFAILCRWLPSVAVVVVVIVAALPVVDSAGSGHVDAAFRRALAGYAIARGLNGAISVAQGTEVAVQPAGIGVNFAPGEILDPVNDLVERFSWIMMLATSSLGIQKVLLSMSAWTGLLLALLVSGLGWLLLRHFAGIGIARYARVAARVFLFLAIVRFMMPAISIANDWVYRAFLENDYIEASAGLEAAREEIGALNETVRFERDGESAVDEPDPTVPGDEAAPAPGLLDRAKAMYRRTVAGVDIERRLEDYRVAAESISENTIRLIVVFLMQTVVFPLVFLFVAWGLLRRMTRF